jgi:hypothetical protein
VKELRILSDEGQVDADEIRCSHLRRCANAKRSLARLRIVNEGELMVGTEPSPANAGVGVVRESYIVRSFAGSYLCLLELPTILEQFSSRLSKRAFFWKRHCEINRYRAKC